MFLDTNQEFITSQYFLILTYFFYFRTLSFELWADKGKILDGQDIIAALVSFYELAFSFQLKYGSGAQTTLEIVQHQIAEYGVDGSGTLTNRKKLAATNQIKKYRNFLMTI